MPIEAVVMVHGIWMTGLELVVLGRRLRRNGFAPHRFPYPSRTDTVAANAERLARFIAGVEADTVHLLGHSLGGLVILQALRTHAALPPGRVILLGSPLCGSSVARHMLHSRAGRWLLGRAGENGLLAGAPPWDGSRAVGVIAGDLPLGAGRLLGGVTGAHDGVVGVAETELPGITAHTVVHCSHSGLVLSPRVARLVCGFLRDGCFPVV